jgi:hypothetical protein
MGKTKKINSTRGSMPNPVLANSPGAFVNFSRQYLGAANHLMPIAQEDDDVIYFLYVHSLELALKAFLRSYGEPIEAHRIHSLHTLIAACVKHGFQPGSDLSNVAEIVRYENSEHGFRYFLFEPTSRPSLSWLREVSNAAVDAICKHVESRPDQDTGTGVVGRFIFDRPVPKLPPE